MAVARIGIGLMVVALLAMAVGCARPSVRYKEVFGDARVRVRLAERVDKSGATVPGGYDHPWNVDAGLLEALLEAVRYKKGKVLVGGGRLYDAFPAASRHAVLRPIREALAQAGPDQVVDFSFVEEKSTLKVFRRLSLTDGVLFRKGGELNIAFRNIAFEQFLGEEGAEAEPNRRDPLESPMRTSWALEPGAGQSLATAGEGGLFGSSPYANWIRLDLSRPWVAVGGAIPKKAAPAMIEVPPSSLPGEVALPDPASLPSPGEIEERLRFLEELRRDGAISERDYLDKKRELERLRDRLPK
jgi:hypothetical protein